MNNFVTV